MPHATTPFGNRVYFETLGSEGPWVALVQGLGLTSRFWFETPELLVREGYRVLSIDNRGVGRSDVTKRPFLVRDMADDLVAALDAQGIDRAVVAGISLGGMIAQEFALRHPTRTEGLVLLATSSGLPHMRLPSPPALLALLAIPVVERGRVGPAHGRVLLSKRDRGRTAELLARFPEAAAADPRTAWGFTSQFIAALFHSTGSRLGRIDCPTVVIGGGADEIQPPGSSEFLARRIPGAKLEIIPDAGHGIPLVEPEVIVRALRTLRAAGSNAVQPGATAA